MTDLDAGQHRSHRPNRRPLGSQEDEFLERRREERQRIGACGVAEVWAVSPKSPEEFLNEPSSALIKRRGTHETADGMNVSRKKKRVAVSDSDAESGSKKRKKSKKKRSKHKHKQKKSKKVKSSRSSEDEDIWEEKQNKELDPVRVEQVSVAEAIAAPIDNENVIIGPMPMSSEDGTGDKPMDFGHALLPGEGAAMAAYVAEGKRIPRRGEIGLTSNEIVSFEDVGYVMSGSRHRRMEAVRMRKENQIYSADEKRALASLNRQERDKREARILSSFRELVKDKTS